MRTETLNRAALADACRSARHAIVEGQAWYSGDRFTPRLSAFYLHRARERMAEARRILGLAEYLDSLPEAQFTLTNPHDPTDWRNFTP